MKHTLIKKELKNGTRILFVNVPDSSSYYFNTICNGGFNYSQKSKYELPHLLEHLAFEGTEKYPKPGQMGYELEKLGGWYNAWTSEENIRYYLVGNVDDYKKLTDLALEQYTRPLFKQKSIDEQKQVVERELKRYIDDDGARVRSLTYSTLFPSKVCFARDRIATISHISRKDILDFYKTTHTQANTLFVVAGDLSSDRRRNITKSIEKAIKNLPVGKKLHKIHELSPDFGLKIQTLPSKLEAQLYFSIGFIKNTYESEIKYRAACNVASAIFNRGDGSRIFRKSRSAGLAYTVNSGISNNLDYSELYIIEKTDPHLSVKLFELCLSELKDITEGNFTNEELNRAKGYMAGGYNTEYETSRALADWYGPMFVDEERLYSPIEFAEQIRAVKREDIKRVLDSFIAKDNWLISIVGKNAEKYKAEFKLIVEKYF
jgi:predicted Zn-dependent peptidase